MYCTTEDNTLDDRSDYCYSTVHKFLHVPILKQKVATIFLTNLPFKLSRIGKRKLVEE